MHGQSGFLKLIGIALLGAGIATFFLVTTIYFIIVVGGGAGVDSAGDILYNPICGFQGGLGALLVGALIVLTFFIFFYILATHSSINNPHHPVFSFFFFTNFPIFSVAKQV